MEPHQDLRRRRYLPLSSDPKPLPELPRSDSSAVLPLDHSTSHHYFSPAPPLLDQSTRWTDQQHNLYIRSLEASFVNELQRSMHLRCWNSKSNTDEAHKCRNLQNSHNKPKQFLALQDGCQKKITLERIAPMLESTADSHVLTESQFDLTSVDGGCRLREPNTCKHDLLCDEEIHARGSFEKQSICSSFHLELGYSTTEVTDQNFKDEEAGSSCMPMVKRLKTATADGSSNDQVVPFGKLHIPAVSTSSNATSENKGHELLSEPSESYHFPKSCAILSRGR